MSVKDETAKGFSCRWLLLDTSNGAALRRTRPLNLTVIYCTVRVTVPDAVFEPDVPVTVMR